MLQYHPSNPFRPIDWRWQWARVMREKKVPSIAKRNLDPTVLAALKFQNKLDKCKDDIAKWHLMEAFPDLYSAYLIFKRGEDEDKQPQRFIIEARILAGQTAADIASALGLSAGVIEYYEKLFFNVSERLNQTDYIMSCVIGPAVYAGLSDRDYDLLWKLFGYLYGPLVLDSFVATTSRRFRPGTNSEVDVALADDARSALQRKVAIVTRTFSVNQFSQSELLNIYARFVEVEKETNSGKAQDIILQNIQIMLDKLPWKAGADNIAENPQIEHYDSMASELRTEELLTISVGQELKDKAAEPTYPTEAGNVTK